MQLFRKNPIFIQKVLLQGVNRGAEKAGDHSFSHRSHVGARERKFKKFNENYHKNGKFSVVQMLSSTKQSPYQLSIYFQCFPHFFS